jgi:hypothetical protein
LEFLFVGGGYDYIFREPVESNVLPPSLKYLETTVLFDKFGIGKDTLLKSLEILKTLYRG